MRFIIPFLLFPFISLSQSLQTIVQQGHELAVVSVAVSSDSLYVATGSKDKSAKLWELRTGRELRSFLGHSMTVTCVQFTPDRKFLITGSNDKTLRIWQLTDGKEVAVITTPNIITDLAIEPSGKFFAAAGYSRSGYADTTYIFDLVTRKNIARLAASADQGMGSGVDLSISPDGKWLASGEDNRIVNLYQTTDWKKVYTFEIENGFCGGCGTRSVFTPDSKYLYQAASKAPLKKFDLANFKLIKTYGTDVDDLTGLALSPDGKRIAIATEESLTFWSATGDSLYTTPAPEKSEFHEIEFTLDSKLLLIGSDNNTAIRWSVADRTAAGYLTGFLNERDRGGLDYDPNFYWQTAIAKYVRLKNNLLVTSDGKSLIMGKFGTKVKRWDISTGKTLMDYSGHKKAVLCYELSRDGKRLITGGGDGKIVVWNVESGDSLTVINSYREPIFDIHFNSDETKVISSSWDGSLKVHDLATAKMLTYVEFEKGSAYSNLITNGDLYFYTARLDNSLQMWEMDTKKEVRNFIGHYDIVSHIALNNDEKILLSASWDGSVRAWDVGTGLMIRKFKGHTAAVHTAIFSQDNRMVYSAGADRVIRVWDFATGALTRTFSGHNGEVTSLVFSPDGKMLISHAVDGVTKFWDLASGKEFFEHIHLGESDWMAKSPDGYFNATEGARKQIHFVNGMQTFGVDQFFNEFYRPELLPKLFQNRGGSSESKSIQGKLKNSPPPTVKIAVVPVSAGKAEVLVRLTDNGNGAMNLKVFHNGKSIPLDHKSLRFPASRGQATTYKHIVDLIGGKNVFSAIASNKENIESDPQQVEYFSEHATRSSTCYILAVGINEYKNSKLSLNYARPDAESFGSVMKGQTGGLFKNIELISLFDKDATRPGILQALDDLSSKIGHEDVFIFYYAGHGSMVDDRFFFIPTESSRLYDEGSLNKEAIEAGLLQDKFKQIKALKQLIIMDACQSGGSVELLATRGAGEEKAIAQLSRSAGIHVMASAGSEQFASEFTSLGHGVFTSVLIRALQGEADGAPKDGKVTIYELKSFIDDQVPEMTKKLKGNPQYPYTFSRGQDFPVVLEE